MSEVRDLALGATAPDFALRDPAGKLWRLADLRGPKGTVVMFIANHCPYVRAAIPRIVRDVMELEASGVRSVAIMPNDIAASPGDGPDKMAEFAEQHGLKIPYLIDETQDVVRTYGAICTPDFFGFDFDLVLRYHGRLDAGGPNATPGARRELFEAMVQIATSGGAPSTQTPSMGCSIKWRAA
jgi:peroxiredoxin